MIPLIEAQQLPSKRTRDGGRRIIFPERQFLKDQRQSGIYIKRYISLALRNAQKFILASAKNYERLAEQLIEFPSREEIEKRWQRVKGTLNVKNPHVWNPNRFPLSFLDYKEDILSSKAEQEFIKSLASINSSTYMQTVLSAAKQMGVPPIFNPQALTAIKEHTFKIVTTDINQTLAAHLKTRIATAIKKGMTIEETARSLGSLNTNWRSIARTETMFAVNKGANDQIIQEAEETDLVVNKGWLHSGNSNGRETHVQAGSNYGPGNEIPMDQPFIVGGEQMMHPHDPDASAKNVVNCGCTTYYAVPEGATQ